MKSEHRHELKTNELADWMAHFPEWAQKNARTLTGAAILIVVVGAAFFWVQYNKNVRVVGERVRFSNLLGELPQVKQITLSQPGQEGSNRLGLVAAGLGKYASKSSNKTMSAMAYLKRAEALRSELHYSATPLDQGELAGRITPIQESYRLAEEKATTDASIRAAARYGQGLCYEELKQFSDAETQYQAMVADESLKGTAGQAAAEYRLLVLPHYQQGLTFRPAPEPEPETETASVVPEFSEDVNAPVVGPTLPEAMDSNATNG